MDGTPFVYTNYGHAHSKHKTMDTADTTPDPLLADPFLMDRIDVQLKLVVFGYESQKEINNSVKSLIYKRTGLTVSGYNTKLWRIRTRSLPMLIVSPSSLPWKNQPI